MPPDRVKNRLNGTGGFEIGYVHGSLTRSLRSLGAQSPLMR